MSRALEVAVAAAEEAGALHVEFFGSLDPADVEEKAKNDMVSRADREAEALLKHAILAAYPHDRFLGEESGASGGSAEAPVWIVDPLDGTANFIRGFPHWAVSIARTSGGLEGPLQVGVIWDPVKEDLFTATAGGGAFRNGARLRMPLRESLAGAAIATGFPFRQQGKIDLYLTIFREAFLEARSIRRAGSATLDLAYTAAGIFDVFFEIGLSPWDTAAGALLVTEAGGVVTDFDGGAKWRTSGNVLAGSPGSHAAFLDLLRALGITESRL